MKDAETPSKSVGVQIATKLSGPDLDDLERLRGDTPRSEYLRGLLRAEVARQRERKSP